MQVNYSNRHVHCHRDGHKGLSHGHPAIVDFIEPGQQDGQLRVELAGHEKHPYGFPITSF